MCYSGLNVACLCVDLMLQSVTVIIGSSLIIHMFS